MPRKSDFSRIMHYTGWKGNADFIKTGERPYCAQCSSKKLEPIVEIVQKGFAGDSVWLVSRCLNCLNTTIFDYELIPATAQELEEMIQEEIEGIEND